MVFWLFFVLLYFALPHGWSLLQGVCCSVGDWAPPLHVTHSYSLWLWPPLPRPDQVTTTQSAAHTWRMQRAFRFKIKTTSSKLEQFMFYMQEVSKGKQYKLPTWPCFANELIHFSSDLDHWFNLWSDTCRGQHNFVCLCVSAFVVPQSSQQSYAYSNI